MAKKINLFVFLPLFIGAISLFRTIILLWDQFLPDFSVFYESSKLLLSNQNLYKAIFFTQINYLPSVVYGFFPLTYLPFKTASNIWIIVSVFLFLVTLFLLFKTLRISKEAVSIIFFLSVIAFPFKFSLGMGQINFVVLFLLSVFLYLFHRGKYFSSVIFLAIAVCIKLFPLFSVLVLLFKKKYELLFISLLLIISVIFLPLLFGKKDILFYYILHVLIPIIQRNSGETYYNQSITGFLARLDVSELFISATRAVLVIIAIFYSIRSKANFILLFGFLLTTALLINNFSWQHHFILLIIPYLVLIKHLKSKKRLSLTFASYILIAVNVKTPSIFISDWYGNILLSHVFLGAFLLWLILLQLINKTNEQQ